MRINPLNESSMLALVSCMIPALQTKEGKQFLFF